MFASTHDTIIHKTVKECRPVWETNNKKACTKNYEMLRSI
jgi:hypothetical protein